MTVEIPGYRILSTLGKGGMATVYLAEQEIFQRKVALKVMAAALAEDPSFGQRFMREARIVSQLVHPNIVTVYDVGVHQGHYYLSMEYIEGEDLKHARRSLNLEQKVQVILDIAKALAYAGNKGYVHRDIKPENIMLYSEDCRAVLTDFGIARAAELDACMTQTGTAIGTPHYMSPEQAKGQSVDIRSDIYGLGVVFYLLLVGCVPYDAESAVAIGIKHITDPLPELPAGLEALQPIIDKMMAKLPEDRYQTPAHLVWDLQNLDMPALLQAAEAAHRDAEASLQSDAEAPTMISRAAPHHLSGSRTPNPALEQEPTPLLVNEPFELEPEDTSFWPWVVGILVLLAVVGGVYYSQYFPVSNDNAAVSRNEGRVIRDEQGSPSSAPVSPSQPTQAEAESAGEAASAPEQQARVAQLREQVDRLTREVEEDPSKLQPLLTARRELAQQNPEGGNPEAAVEAVVRNEVARIRQLARSGELDAAQRRLEQLTALSLPQAYADFAELEAFVGQQAEIREWLTEANHLLEQGQLIEPEGANARVLYQRVLNVDPGNSEAIEGLAAVADRLVERAGEALNEDRRVEAAELLETALSLAPHNQQASDLQEAVVATGVEEAEPSEASGSAEPVEVESDDAPQGPAENEQIDGLLQRARSQMEEANYFQPAGQSAYDSLAQAEALQPDHVRVQQHIEKLRDEFETRMLNLLAVGHYDVVRQLVENARERAPHDPELAALELRVKDAIAEGLLQTESRIVEITVAGVPIKGAEESEPAQVQTDRSLAVSFRYKNFGEQATVIHATLMDGSRTSQIAQVPVVLTEDEGIKTFRIDRPVEGYPSGRYFLELHAGDTTLGGGYFQVQ